MHSVPAGSGEPAPADALAGRHDLAIGCFASICRDRLADELIAFSRRCPEADIGVHEMSRGALLPALRAGTLSMAVLPGAPEPDTRSAEIWHDRVMVALPLGHPLADGAAVEPSALTGETFIVSRQQFGGEMHRFLTQLILPGEPALSATIIDVGVPRIIARVAAGDGLALICESHLGYLSSSVAVRPVAAPGAKFPVRAYWRDGKEQGPLAALVAALEAGATR